MENWTWAELEERLSRAKEFIRPGSRWLHYKGDEYVVVDLALIELTKEVAVIYRSVKHPAATFIRPLVVWQEGVEWEGVKVFRFRPVSSEER